MIAFIQPVGCFYFQNERVFMTRRNLLQMYRKEFAGYSAATFKKDLLAGLTVAAVALPLALAFGVASGSSAAAGLVTAVIAGLVIGLLSGAPFQISGPTGAMSAVLIVLAQKYGLQAVWIAGFLSGFFLLLIGILRLGRFIAFIPSAVITGFTSGISLIIFIGQVDNLLGVKTAGAESALLKAAGYVIGGFTPNWYAVILGGLVILTMLLWPKKWNAVFPSSLMGIIVATGTSLVSRWPVETIGTIPQTILLDQRLDFSSLQPEVIMNLITPALAITALGAIESLLCGAVASRMTGTRLHANQELIGQGIGNMLIPFFGGVPATAAIARTSVGIKSGGVTRMVSIIHAAGLLIFMLLMAPVIERVPMAALAGVLMVTAWRMNEWDAIRYMFSKRFKTAMTGFLVTLVATITLDLTQAIIAGTFIAAAIFLSQIAQIEISVQEVDPVKLKEKGIDAEGKCSHVKVAFITGPVFFAATSFFNEAFSSLGDTHALILSMRGVPLIDTAGIEALEDLQDRLSRQGGTMMLAGTHDNVKAMLERSGLAQKIGQENFFWSSDQAIVEAERRGCKFC